MKIAYLSPFSPDPSGISDFSEELVPELKKHMSIDLFTQKKIENPEINEEFNIYNIDDLENEQLRSEYDMLVYQVGNNRKFHEKIIKTFLKYPDILELHDFSLHHYLAEETFAQGKHEEYVKVMKLCHGIKGEKTARDFLAGVIQAPWERESETYPVNKYLIDKARAVIVHSDMAKQMVKGIRPDVKVINIPLHTTDVYSDYKSNMVECRQKLGIPQDILVMGSFGYANTSKRIEPILHALALFAKKKISDFRYYIVGRVQGIDIDKLVAELGLKERVIVTDFVDLTLFKQYMGACDFCFNLRYPTQGESSASLHRMLGMGKPALLTQIGTFEEYSDDFSIKISHGDKEVTEICNAICKLALDEKLKNSMSEKAFKFAKERCSLEGNGRKYYSFFKDILEEHFQEDYLDYCLDKLYALGVNSNAEYFEYYISNIVDEIEAWNVIDC